MARLPRAIKQAGKRPALVAGTAAAAALGLTFALAQPSWGSNNAADDARPYGGNVVLSGGGDGTATPIKHVVVIFDENVSFDHYFGTYPNAANTDGTKFHAKADTPAVNGLTSALLNNNPNGVEPEAPEQLAAADL